MSTKEIAVTPAQMIELAVKSNADLEKLEKLLELQQRWEAGEARKVYTSAFAQTQEEIASVSKSKANPITHSKYADLADVIEMAKPCYTKHGFSVIFYEGDGGDKDCVRICADVLHSSGHKESYHLDMPMDGVGFKGQAMMTRIHAKASSISYARRYLMYMIFNIPTADDDGNAATVQVQEQKPIQQPQSKFKNLKHLAKKPEDELPVFHEPVKEQKFVTSVHKITKKGLDFRILGDEDIIFITKQESFATLAKSAKEAGLKISGTHRDFIIIDIDMVEPSDEPQDEPQKETQQEFLDGLDKDAVKEGFKDELPY